MTHHIAGGDPCRGIRKRFGDELISYLLELKWWDWDEKKIFRNLEALVQRGSGTNSAYLLR